MDEMERFRKEVKGWVEGYYWLRWRATSLQPHNVSRLPFLFYCLAVFGTLILGGSAAFIFLKNIIGRPMPSDIRFFFSIFAALVVIFVTAASWRILSLAAVWWHKRLIDRRIAMHMAQLPLLENGAINDIKMLMNVSNSDLKVFTETLRELKSSEGKLSRWSFFQELHKRWCFQPPELQRRP